MNDIVSGETLPLQPEAAAGKGTRIVRSALHDEVVRRVREMIFEGELQPGAHVPERVLCEKFGISRTPLREAMKVLATEGLIELLPHRGAVVTALSARDVEDMFQVMGALEALVGEIVCTRISEADIKTLHKLHKQMVQHYKRGERLEYFRLNQQIHELIVNASGNPILINMYNTLSGRIRRARYMATLTQERWDQAVKEHEEMLDAIEARDGARLGQILRDHLKHDSVKEHLIHTA